MHRHQCFVYEGAPSRNLPAVMATIKQKLRQNQRCLYLDSPPMVAGMRSYLAAADVDVAGEVTKKSLVLSSEQQHLVAGRFNVERMMETLNDALDQALKDGYDGLWATGDNLGIRTEARLLKADGIRMAPGRIHAHTRFPEWHLHLSR